MPSFSTQRYLRIGEIHDDTIVLKSGGLRAVIETSSVNMHLKSEEEQTSLLYGYQGFLNTLEFPIQIVVRSKKLDVSTYLDSVHEKAAHQNNGLLKRMTQEYAEYIRRLVEFADIMEKHFYVIIPYDPMRTQDLSMLQKFMQYIHPAEGKTAQRQSGYRAQRADELRTVDAAFGDAGFDTAGLR